MTVKNSPKGSTRIVHTAAQIRLGIPTMQHAFDQAQHQHEVYENDPLGGAPHRY